MEDLRSRLPSVPGEMLEAVKCDGAGPWRAFWSVRWLMPAPAVTGRFYICWLSNSAYSTAEFTVDAPSSGRYLLIVHYAHNDRRDNGHSYNTDIMSRTADITVGTDNPRTVTFKNTWSWDDYWTLGLPVDLREGSNKVIFGNAGGWAPDIDRIQLGRVRG